MNRLRRITSLNLLADTQNLVKKDSNNMDKIDEQNEEEEENINLMRNSSSMNKKPKFNDHKDDILVGISELINELESIGDVIKEEAKDHINDNDVILTANHSDQLEDFFIEASQEKTFHVIIAESAPSMK